MTNRIEYAECDLKPILDSWARDFKMTNPKEHIFNYEWFLDPVKGIVMYRLYISDNPDLKLPSLGTGGKE